jgi:DNA-binding response OmpR family regulator
MMTDLDGRRLPVCFVPTGPRAPAVLYVEDNVLVARFVCDALELAGCKVHHFSESAGARIVLESETRFDLLLLDEEMRHLSGLELVRLARALRHRRATPIILCSVEDRAEEARAAGSDEFLRKPADLHRLVDTVRRLLGGRKKG